MGLDMYLSRKVHISNYDHDVEGSVMAAAVMNALNVKDLSQYGSGSLNVTLPAGYWRKANAIHAWFVRNVQDGIDNCEDHHVSTEQLTELRDLCQKIVTEGVNEENTKLLPTQSGFFFGNTDYDEWYIADLQDTINICNRVLDPENAITKYDDFVYCSSW